MVRAWAVLGANLVMVGVLVLVGAFAHSLAVWAEGADYLGDAGGIAVALLAVRLDRAPPTPRRPRGFPRATRFAALINAGWLLAVSLAVFGGALARLAAGAGEIRGLAVLVVSGAAALVMGASALLLRHERLAGEAGEEDFNLSAIMLDTVSDAASAGGVAAAGAIIYVTRGFYWLDPVAALAVSVVVAYHSARLLARTTASLRGSKVGL